MNNKPKTIFCDIDGTLCEYPYTNTKNGEYDFDSIMTPLPGTLKKLWEWDKLGHMIILTTGRKEGLRTSTEKQLRKANHLNNEEQSICFVSQFCAQKDITPAKFLIITHSF